VRAPLAFWLATRRGPVALGTVWRAIAPPASIAAVMVLTVGALRTVLADPTPAAMATVAATALAIVLLGLLAWPETRREVRQALASRRLSFAAGR
jgi:PST family polysaccharide transporter